MRLYTWDLCEIDYGHFSVTVAARTEQQARDIALAGVDSQFEGYNSEHYRAKARAILLRKPAEDDPTPKAHWQISPE